jgi:hypothetical protein
MVLSEVALGKIRQLTTGDTNAYRLPEGYNSVMGVGEIVPNQTELNFLDDNVQVPKGPLVKDPSISSLLLHNEFIVYNTAQTRMRFVVVVQVENANEHRG